MSDTLREKNAAWISVFMRIAIIIFLGLSGVRKVMGGVGTTIPRFQEMYAGTGTPMWLVTGQAWAVPFIEVFIGLWLLVGYKLRGAFIASALLTLNFCVAMKILSNHGVVANNSLFVLLCCVGLYFCDQDRLSLDHYLAIRKTPAAGRTTGTD